MSYNINEKKNAKRKSTFGERSQLRE